MNLLHLLVLASPPALAVVGPPVGSQQVLVNPQDPYPRLNFSSPSPLIFHSTFGLLQQWPNTFFGSGHTIAPCVVPKNTNLYHARGDAAIPRGPEWFSLDPAMSYAILGGGANSHMLTYRTVKDVNCLYFDGTSAKLMSSGSMDSQMLFIYNDSASIPDDRWMLDDPPPRWGDGRGRPRFDPVAAEYDRAEGLCNLIKERGLGGSGWGFEGIVRMNAGFELIWCDFSSPSAQLVSHLNVSAPLLAGVDRGRRPWLAAAANERQPPSDHTSDEEPGRDPGGAWPGPDHPFAQTVSYHWFEAAARRYGFGNGVPGRGESRVKIDSCNLFTFYDPLLAGQETSRVAEERRTFNLSSDGHWLGADDQPAGLQKLARRRRGQRVANMSAADGAYLHASMFERMRAALDGGESACSHIDWVETTRTIVDFYSSSLYALSEVLSRDVGGADTARTRQWLADTRDLAHSLYMPFWEYPAFTPDTLSTAFSPEAATSQAALQRCIAQSDPIPGVAPLSASEALTQAAVRDVLTAVCGTLLPVALASERLWLANFNNASAAATAPGSDALAAVHHAARSHADALARLRAYLGWADQWTACEPACPLGSTCFVPMWPVSGFGPGGGGGRHRGGGEALEEFEAGDRGDWVAWDRGGHGGFMGESEKFLWEPTCVDAASFPPS